MQLDLVLLGVVAFFAMWGALTGAARQIAYFAAAILAFLGARPLGSWLAPKISAATGSSPVLGVLVATLAGFLVIYLAVRHAGTYLLRRGLAGRDPSDRRLDRALGFLLGGAKSAFFIYLAICALSFVEANVAVAGKRLGLSPEGSQAFALARRFNLFEMARLPMVQDLLTVARALRDPEGAGKLKSDPAFQALRKDPRVRAVLEGEAVRRALETGDGAALDQNDPVRRLLRDPDLAAKLRSAAEASER